MITSRQSDGVCHLTLDRPNSLNAINPELTSALGSELDRIASDPAVRVVVLSGAGRAFCAGVDIKKSSADEVLTSVDDWRRRLKSQIDLVFKLWDLPQPVIAAVHGYCLGLGCDLAATADFVIAAETTIIGEPEIEHASASTFLILPHLLGLRRSKQLLLSGELINATDAMRMNLVTKVVPDDRLLQEAEALAAKLCRIPDVALRLNKVALNAAFERMGLRETVYYNLETFVQIRMSNAAQAFDRMVAERGLKAALGRNEETDG
jgi:enoyl-CoA hydratase